MNIAYLAYKSIQYRRAILKMIKIANAGHIGGDLSCTDILNVLYNAILNVSPQNFNCPLRDRYVHSKGHSVEALYAVLADRGFFPNEDLATVGKPGSDYIGHPTRKVFGIEQNTGALGHGLSFSVGLAISGKKDRLPFRVFTLLGDGELDEGSIWEASMCASHYRLDNLVVIVDRNRLQITAGTEDVMALEPLADKFRAFGYILRDVDGHDIQALIDVFSAVPFEAGKPNLVLAHTTKGKGISFIENRSEWHHHVPDDEEYQRAVTELAEAEERWIAQYGTPAAR